MGSEAPSSTAAANPISPTSSISPSKEDGGLEARSEAPAAVVDDYETAPEPEDSDVKAPLAANEKGGDPTRVLNPNLVVVEEMERIEMESLHDEKVDEHQVVEDGKVEVLGGGSIVEDGKGEVLGGGSIVEYGKVEVLGGGSIVEDGKVEVLGGGSIVEDGKGEVLGGGSIVEYGKGEVLGGGSFVEDGKGEVLGGGSIVEEGKDEVLGGRWKEECPNSAAMVKVEGESKIEVNGEGESNHKGKDGSLGESKSIAVGAEAGVEKKDEGNGESDLVAAVPLPLEGEKVEMEKETESKPVAEAEAEAEEVVAGDIVGSKAAAEAKKLDNVEESKAAESAYSVAVSEKETEIVGESPGPKAWEEDKSTSVVVAGELNDSAGEATVPKDAVEDIGVLEADKNEAVDGAVSQRSLELETVAEKPLFNSDQVLADLQVKPGDGGGDLSPHQSVEPSPALGEGFKSKKTEVETSGTSAATEGGTASEVSGDSMLQASASVEKAEPDAEVSYAADDDENPTQIEAEEEEEEDDVSDQQPRVAILDSSETAKELVEEMEKGSSSAIFEISRSFQPSVDGQQIVSDSDEEGDGKEDAALVAMLNAATGGSSDGNITLSSQDGYFASAPSGPTLFGPSGLAVTAEPENEMDEEERKLHEKVEAIRVKFLRVLMRLGHASEDSVAASVLYRLSLAEWIRRGGQMGGAFSIESAKKKAIQLEEEGKEDLNFSCNILVLGKTGVGKSATINSIFGGEEKSRIDAFQAATTSVREISGVVDGVKIRVIDTPGLESSVMDQATNRRILSSIKKYTKKCPPDIVLYTDRLDTQTQDFNDLHLLRSITSALGSSLWFNAIVALTHAASPPPEGPNGPLNYEAFIAQRSHVVQHSIRQAARDMRVITPAALVENHPSCRRNREGERVLPNGTSWRPRLLLLCYASKILSEANTLLKLRDPSPGKFSGFRHRFQLLPHLLFALLQSRTHPRLSNDHGGDNGDPDIGLDDFSDEDEDEYDQLPPFKPLKKSQLAKLTKEQKRAYFDEYDYRVKLLQKKQFKEEIRRLNEMKKKGRSGRGDDSPYGGYDVGEEFDDDGAPAAVQVPLPDMVLPPSFDCDAPTYRYRYLEPTSQLLTGPVLDTHGWDHDCGYDGVALEKSLAIANRFPAAVAGQITKDKKDFSIHLDSSVAAKIGENGSALAGFDIQPLGEHLAYILQSEAKFHNLKKNKTAAGISVTFVGDTVATGLKVEDQLMIGKRVGLVACTGAVKAQGDVAYGANLEARLREEDYPTGRALSTLGLSLMKLRGVLALEANLQSQVNVGRNSKMAVRVVLNNKRSGRITIRTSTSEQLQLALVGILPVALSIFRRIWPGESEYSR